MQSWHFQGRSLSGSQRERISQVFGRMTWVVTAETFSCHIPPMPAPETYRYRIAGATSSTASIEFTAGPGFRMPHSSTVYFDGDAVFIKAGTNFEYFRRVEA